MRGVATAGGVAVSGRVATGTAGAVHNDIGKPDHVSLSFDQARLEQWQPLLDTSNLDILPDQMYGWIAESDLYDTDAFCYWTFYDRQEGLSTFDSHVLDREPVYVFSDGDTLEEVVYSGYHWLAATASGTAIARDGDHPLFHIAEDYHHYYEGGNGATDLEIDDLDSVFDDWLATGWEDDLGVGLAQEPWLIRDPERESWWQRNSFGFNGKEWGRQLLHNLGLYGAEVSDI